MQSLQVTLRLEDPRDHKPLKHLSLVLSEVLQISEHFGKHLRVE